MKQKQQPPAPGRYEFTEIAQWPGTIGPRRMKAAWTNLAEHPDAGKRTELGRDVEMLRLAIILHTYRPSEKLLRSADGGPEELEALGLAAETRDTFGGVVLKQDLRNPRSLRLHLAPAVMRDPEWTGANAALADLGGLEVIVHESRSRPGAVGWFMALPPPGSTDAGRIPPEEVQQFPPGEPERFRQTVLWHLAARVVWIPDHRGSNGQTSPREPEPRGETPVPA